MNVSKSIPNLIGGISQQPSPSRLPNQLEDQNNFVSSPAFGLQNRPPLKVISASPYKGNGAFFILDKDSTTQHNMWISPEGIRIEDLTGKVKPVACPEKVRSYLSLPEGAIPENNYRILPVADSCFILNRTKAPTIDDADVPPYKNQALVHIKQVNYSTTWSLTVDNVTVFFGYDAKPDQLMSTAQVATALAEQLLANEAINTDFSVVTASSVIWIKRKDNAPFKIALGDTRGDTYSSLTTYKIKKFTDLPTVAPDGFTCKVIGATGTPSDDYYVKFTADNIIKTYNWVSMGASQSLGGFRRLSGTKYRVGETVASKLHKGTPIRNLKAPSMLAYVTSVSKQSYTYNVHTGGHDGDTEQVIAEYFMVTLDRELTGSADELQYASSVQTHDVLARGVWEECAEPEAPHTIDPSNMPHLLVHNVQDDSWGIREVNWSHRLAGDEHSSPWPSFIGKPLTDLFLYRNRLGIIAGDSVSMSAAGDLERFFPETVQTQTDADPIDISVSVDDFSDIEAAVTLQDKLLFFSAQRQYTLASPDILSPKTAAILPSTAYPCTPDAGLPVLSDHLCFVHSETESAQVREYSVDSYSGTKSAELITAHVPTLLPTGHSRLAASSLARCLVYYSSDAPNTLYLYQYYDAGGNRLQSAWSRHTVNARILNIAFREATLWIELVKDSRRLLCTMDFSETYDTEKAFTPALDFQKKLTNTAKFTLPYTPDTGKLVVLYRDDKKRFMPIKPTKIEGRTITLSRAYDALIVGEVYSQKAVFSHVWPTQKGEEGASKVLTDGRFQLRRWTVQYFESGPFTLTVEDTVTHKTIAYHCNQIVGQRTAILGTPSVFSGHFTAPCRGRNTEIQVSVESDNYFPHTYLSMNVVGNYIVKNRPI